MSDCPLCHTPLDGDVVPFGLFRAHEGCADDWARSETWEQEWYDALESQEG